MNEYITRKSKKRIKLTKDIKKYGVYLDIMKMLKQVALNRKGIKNTREDLQMKAKKIWAVLLAAAMTASMLAGCSSGNAEDSKSKAEETKAGETKSEETNLEETTGDDKASEASAKGWTGEITFFAKEYTPKEPDEINPNPPKKLKEYAAEYEKAHPGVSINFVNLPGDVVMNEYIRTQASAKQLPDITFINYAAIGTQLPKEMFTLLDPYFEKETPYVEGKKWGETFNDAVMEMTQVGAGSHYSVSADYVETGIYYNKAMFKEAGITETPTTWEEFIEVCKKLKDAGKVPMAWSMAQDDTYSTSWTNRIFLSNCYGNDIDKIDIDGVKGVNDMEKIVALKNGVVKVDDGKFLSYFDALKDMVPYFNDSWASKTDLEKKFMQEEVAMYWTGSWLPKKMTDAGVDFEYASFPFPTPTKETFPSYSTDKVTSGAVGGPSASFQYSVSSEKANKTMSPEKLKVVMDWLMYITEPAKVSEIVNEYGSFCPTIKGSTPLPGMEGLLDNLNADYTNFDGGQSITGTVADTMFRNLHQYMLGEVTKEEVISALSKTMEEEADTAIENNPDWNIDQYLNK